MKKSTKGAVAAAAAGVLLLGGAGSLAFWSATDTVTGTNVTAGELKIDDADCTDWAFDGSEVTANKTYDPATDRIVPGDTLTRSCDWTLTAVGEHLRATVLTEAPGATGDLAPALTVPFPVVTVKDAPVGSDYSDGDTIGTITEHENGAVLTATQSITFNPGSDNSTQSDGVATLVANSGDFTITFSQVHNP